MHINMKKITHTLFMIIITISLTACANKQQTGTFLGGALGGVVGSNVGAGQGRTAAIIGGTFLGSLFGSSIGSSLDKADQMYMYRAQNSAYGSPIGHQINWHNPKSGNSGSVLPVREGTSVRGDYCREFKQSIYIDGKMHQAHGSACQQPDGSWRITQ